MSDQLTDAVAGVLCSTVLARAIEVGVASPQALSDACGVSVPLARRLLAGGHIYALPTIGLLSRGLRCTIDDLLGCSDTRRADEMDRETRTRGWAFEDEPQLILFKRRLRAAMRIDGIPEAAELARRSGVTSSAIMSYLRGTRLPSAVSLIRLSRALDVSCDWLLGFDAAITRRG